MIWILFIVFLCYIILIISLIIGFSKMKNFDTENVAIKTKFSVIIPFRNEGQHLPELLKSILNLNYPASFFEIILVDDDSTDDSVSIIKNTINVIPNEERRGISKLDLTNIQEISPKAGMTIRIIRNQRQSNSPKKDAILTAIKKAKYNWIITTDADCILSQNWLKTIDSFIQKGNPKMIVAPVSYKTNNTFLDQFQLLDFYSLQGATIGGFGIKKSFLCNGANLAYKKEDFIELNGFLGNDNIASGDDIFLFEKFIKNDATAVQFLKSTDAIVKTFPVKNWNRLINQRVRWAAKTGNYKLWFGKMVGLIVFCANIALIAIVFLAIFEIITLESLIIFWSIKIIVDYILIQKLVAFFKQKIPIKWYFVSSFLYPFFSVLVVLKSLFSNYHWKGRSFKK